MTPRGLTVAAYARSKGLAQPTVRRLLIRAGLVAAKGKHGHIDPAQADAVLAASKPVRYKAVVQPTDTIISYNEAERRNKLAKAIQEELKLQQIQGTLVLRSAVEREVFDAVRRSRDAIQNIPARISGILAAEQEQAKIFIILTQEIQQALEGLAALEKLSQTKKKKRRPLS